MARKKKEVDIISELIKAMEKEQQDTANTTNHSSLMLTLEEPKLQKLKSIAKFENKEVKQIVSDVLVNYILEYESNKGRINIVD